MTALPQALRQKMIEVCDQKIATKGAKNTNPRLLMAAARWWIETHELDHFEKAVKIKAMVSE
jgi:hypothetical protein